MFYTRFFYTVHLIHVWFEAMNCLILFKQHCLSGPDKQLQRIFWMHTLVLISAIPSNITLMYCSCVGFCNGLGTIVRGLIFLCVCVQQVLLILWDLYYLSWFHFSSVARLIHWQPFSDIFLLSIFSSILQRLILKNCVVAKKTISCL